MTINKAERKQGEFDGVIGVLSAYSTKRDEYVEAKNKLLNNAKIFTRGEKELLRGLKMEQLRQIMMKKEKNNGLSIKKKKKISEMKIVSLAMKIMRD